MESATIKNVIAPGMYSFATVDGGDDVFLAPMWTKKLDLKVGDRVELEVEQGPRGARAKSVRRVEAS
jgi:cold shock CspA family protein